MRCAGCGYENPIALARCPRCGCSEETIVARSLAAATAAVDAASSQSPSPAPSATEPPADPPPAASLTLATRVTPARVPAPAADFLPRPPAAAESYFARRPEADWVPIAVIGGAILAFMLGTMLGISLLPSRAVPTPRPAPMSMMPPEPARGALASRLPGR